MTDEKKEGLKVAYRGSPTEEEIRTIQRKQNRIQTILTILFVVIAAIVGYFAYTNAQNTSDNQIEQEEAPS